MIGVFVLILYVIGAVLTWTRVYESNIKEFGPPKNFGDFGTNVYLATSAGLIWPIVAVFYVVWRLSR